MKNPNHNLRRQLECRGRRKRSRLHHKNASQSCQDNSNSVRHQPCGARFAFGGCRSITCGIFRRNICRCICRSIISSSSISSRFGNVRVDIHKLSYVRGRCLLGITVTVEHGMPREDAILRIWPLVRNHWLRPWKSVVIHLSPYDRGTLGTISCVSLTIGRIEPLGSALVWHALIRNPELKGSQGKVRMAILTRVVASMHIRAEIAPDNSLISYFL
mmetsp:Transcript_23026/g.35351  ORF Transcript_23026/g.35351 Transcript_23026/m.35351 type:complete len:216 (+) Transcript_23026:862-1509(+)